MRQLSADILRCSEKRSEGRRGGGNMFAIEQGWLSRVSSRHCSWLRRHLSRARFLPRVSRLCRARLRRSLSFSRIRLWRHALQVGLDRERERERGRVSIGTEAGGGWLVMETKGEWMGECARGALYTGCPEYRCVKCHFDVSSEHSMSKVTKSIVNRKLKKSLTARGSKFASMMESLYSLNLKQTLYRSYILRKDSPYFYYGKIDLQIIIRRA